MNPKLSGAKRPLKWTQKPTKDRRKHPRSPSLALKDMGLGKILIPCTKHGCTPILGLSSCPAWAWHALPCLAGRVTPSKCLACTSAPCWVCCPARKVLSMHFNTPLGGGVRNPSPTYLDPSSTLGSIFHL